MASLGNRYYGLHLIGVALFILTASLPPDLALGFNELWEQADLIVEGKITDIWVQDGEAVGTVEVRAVIKPVGSSTLYTKGFGMENKVVVRSPVEVGDTYHRLFLEQVGKNEYRVIKTENIPKQEPSGDSGVFGLAALISITALAYLLSRS